METGMGLHRCNKPEHSLAASRGELWWGYKHVNDTLQVKRFCTVEDIFDARRSDFVAEVKGPFRAHTREEALKNLQILLDGGSL